MASNSHDIIDRDSVFVIDPTTRSVVQRTTDKLYLMQYDHNSERFTFELPLEIEGHDMSLCDTILIHWENSSTGTSASVRRVRRDVYIVKSPGENAHDDVKIDEEKQIMTFSWLVGEESTQNAGPLKFQLKFICHDEEFEGETKFKWHTNVNDSITIRSGLSYEAGDIPPSATATLQSLEIIQLDTGIEVILDGRVYTIETPKATSIDESSSDEEYATAKAVYDLVSDSVTGVLTTDVEV